MRTWRSLSPDPMDRPLRRRYEALVKTGALEGDAGQSAVADALDRYGAAPSGPGRARGLYVHGRAGGGKTMLAELHFHEAAIAPKRWAPLHAFLADLHDRLHSARLAIGDRSAGNAFESVVGALAAETALLCLDEFEVADVAGALLLHRVLSGLLDRGVRVVVTSNVAPRDLYEGGVNRALIQPLIDFLETAFDVVPLAPPKDFRLGKARAEGVWRVPAGSAAEAAFDQTFDQLTGGAPATSMTLCVKGHTLKVRRQARGVARFTYSELCLAPLGPSDDLAIATAYHTVIVEAVPARFNHRNHARRFCMLIDLLYEHGVRLFVSAAVEPEALFTALLAALRPALGEPTPPSETSPEALEFRRTESRLMEMCSRGYPVATVWASGADVTLLAAHSG